MDVPPQPHAEQTHRKDLSLFEVKQFFHSDVTCIGLQDVVACEVSLLSMKDFAEVNKALHGMSFASPKMLL